MTATEDGGERVARFLDGFADRPVPVLVPDLIARLRRHLTAPARLCSATLCGLGQRDAWTCAYRNVQMLLSSAIGHRDYGDRIAAQFDRRLPSVSRLQELIESAWRHGFDADGAAHFNHRLLGSRRWVGTTEVAALLLGRDVRCHLVDCDRPGRGRAILQRLGQYYRGDGTDMPAVYFQYDGHSVTVVGVEFDAEDGQPRALLVVDPARVRQDGAVPTGRYTQRDLDDLPQCQMLFLDGVGWQSPAERQRSMVLQSTRLGDDA